MTFAKNTLGIRLGTCQRTISNLLMVLRTCQHDPERCRDICKRLDKERADLKEIVETINERKAVQ